MTSLQAVPHPHLETARGVSREAISAARRALRNWLNQHQMVAAAIFWWDRGDAIVLEADCGVNGRIMIGAKRDAVQ